MKLCIYITLIFVLGACGSGQSGQTIKTSTVGLNNKGYEIIDFYADWCGPCKMMAPVIEQYNKEAKYKITKMNVDKNTDLANKSDIKAIPTIVPYKDGQEVSRFLGFKPIEDLKKWVEENTVTPPN